MAVLDRDIGLVEKAVTAENTFSDGLYTEGAFNLSISGTFLATVTVQRSFDQGSTWRDVDTFTAPIETYGNDPEPVVVYHVELLKCVFTLLIGVVTDTLPCKSVVVSHNTYSVLLNELFAVFTVML